MLTMLSLFSLSLCRTVDGLQLIAARADFVNLFLPYGKCYCVTLEEWSFLIKTLSAISENSPEVQIPTALALARFSPKSRSLDSHTFWVCCFRTNPHTTRSRFWRAC